MKKITLGVGVCLVVASMLVLLLVLKHIKTSKHYPQIVNLPETFSEKDKSATVSQPERHKKREKIIDNKPEPKLEKAIRREKALRDIPAQKETRRVEPPFPEKSLSTISRDTIKRNEPNRNNVVNKRVTELSAPKEIEELTEGSLPSRENETPLPPFEPIGNDTGPIVKGQEDDHPESIQEFYLAIPEPVKEHNEYNEEGLPVPPDLDIKTLPSFTPVTNETGPVGK